MIVDEKIESYDSLTGGSEGFTAQDLADAQQRVENLQKEVESTYAKYQRQKADLNKCKGLRVKGFNSRETQCRKDLGVGLNSYERMYDEAQAAYKKAQANLDKAEEHLRTVEDSIAKQTSLASEQIDAKKGIEEISQQASMTKSLKAKNYLMYAIISAVVLVIIVFVIKLIKK